VTALGRTWFTSHWQDRARCFQCPAIEGGGPRVAGPCQQLEEPDMATYVEAGEEEAEEVAEEEAAATEDATSKGSTNTAKQ
jgi:hypothetical protein